MVPIPPLSRRILKSMAYKAHETDLDWHRKTGEQMPKESSPWSGYPLRVLYVADYQSDKLIKNRGIRSNLHTGGSNKIGRIAGALGLANCEVTVLASGIVANRSAKIHRGFRDEVEGTGCEVIYAPSIDIPVASHAVALMFGAWYLLTHKRPDVTLVYNMSALSLSLAYVAKFLKRSEVYFEYEDDCHVPLSGARLGSKVKGSICVFLARRIASGCICVNQALATQMRNIPTYVLEGIADVQRDTPSRNVATRLRRPVWHLTYVGGINRLKGVLSLVPLMKELGPEYSLQIVGNGPLMDELQNGVAEFDLKTISIRGSLSVGEVQKVCDDTDIFINPHIVRLGHIDAIFPFKIVEYLSFGRPVVSTQLAESALGSLGGFQFAESDDPKAIASAVRACTSKYSEFAARMPAVRRFIWENYSVERVGERLRTFFKSGEAERR
jgi:glycosyltransferase involved in cell wall biosynthesis